MASAATIGFFDGVHTGHRFVLDNLARVASARGLTPAAVVFEDHPQSVLRGVSVPLLTSFDERVALLKTAGVEEIIAFSFREVQHYTAEEFMRLLHDCHDVKMLVMGYDHRFGSDRMTDFVQYEQCAERVGLQLVCLPRNPESNASSTRIRKALQAGDVRLANEMLGYAYTLSGVVVEGRKIGREIGFPTANMQLPPEKLVPASGVYACEVEGRKAVLNIGTNPTVQGTKQTVELHVPAFEGNLYGRHLTVRLLRYLRPEQKFDSLEMLKEQIEKDVAMLKER